MIYYKMIYYKMILYTLTPLLGALRNYVKYKQFRLHIFIKTPITYFIIHKFLKFIKLQNIILYTLILERWFFLFYKTFLSIKNDDYNTKRNKYIKKYNLNYSPKDKLNNELNNELNDNLDILLRSLYL